jgi:hypothetical protein
MMSKARSKSRDEQDNDAVLSLVMFNQPLPVAKVYDKLLVAMGRRRIQLAIWRLIADGKVTYNPMWELTLL